MGVYWPLHFLHVSGDQGGDGSPFFRKCPVCLCVRAFVFAKLVCVFVCQVLVCAVKCDGKCSFRLSQCWRKD